VGVAPPTASHWALRPRPLTCRRHWTGFSGNAQADNIFRTLFANKRIHILGGPNPPLQTAHTTNLHFKKWRETAAKRGLTDIYPFLTNAFQGASHV